MSEINALEADMNFSELINQTINEVDIMDLSRDYVILANVVFEDGDEQVVMVDQLNEVLMEYKDDIVSVGLVVDVVALKEDIIAVTQQMLEEVFGS